MSFTLLVGRVGTLNVTHYTQCELRVKPRLRTLLQLADTNRGVVHKSAVVHYAIEVHGLVDFSSSLRSASAEMGVGNGNRANADFWGVTQALSHGRWPIAAATGGVG